jgi:hypothetical protein
VFTRSTAMRAFCVAVRGDTSAAAASAPAHGSSRCEPGDPIQASLLRLRRAGDARAFSLPSLPQRIARVFPWCATPAGPLPSAVLRSFFLRRRAPGRTGNASRRSAAVRASACGSRLRGAARWCVSSYPRGRAHSPARPFCVCSPMSSLWQAASPRFLRDAPWRVRSRWPAAASARRAFPGERDGSLPARTPPPALTGICRRVSPAAHAPTFCDPAW